MKYLLLTISLFLCYMGMFSQATISLNTARTTGGTLTACQQVSLKPGFGFKATATSSLTLTVNPSTCDPYGGSTSSVSSNQNYIQTKTYTTDNGSRYLESIQYFDGLGRPTQTVQRGVTPNTADLVTWQEYDAFGRESNSWLPVAIASNNGAFADLTKVKANMNAVYPGDAAPFSKPVYEASPLNRILEQYGPGADWQSKGQAVKTEYLTNSGISGQLSCALFTVDGTGMATKVKKAGFYANNQLYVTKMTDEDSNISYEFKDKLGQVVLTRQILGTANLDTYYVYDDFGNLCFALPPMVSEVLIQYTGSWDETNSTPIKQYAYLYKYDDRNRCIWKRLPGCEPVFYVYDKADRLILSQDGEQRIKKPTPQWTFNKYDAFGRIIVSGSHPTTASHATLIAKCKDIVVTETRTTGTFGYTWKQIPEISYLNTLLVNHYDDYDFLLDQRADFRTLLKYTAKSGYGERYIHSGLGEKTPKGSLTGTRIKYISPDNTVIGEIVTAMYYDSRGRLIQTKSINHMGGVDEEYIAYNFTGQPTKKMHIHSATGKTTQTEVYAYSYDHAGRMTKETHQLNSGAVVTLAENTYDELGRLKTNQKHTHASLKTTYGYNVRSWTKTISSPLFAQTLYYNESYGGSKAQYNGNIGAMIWKVQDEASTLGYTFSYDNLSRLTAAKFIVNGNHHGGYEVPKITYDKQGNITQLQLWGKKDAGTTPLTYAMVDDLTMSYSGNQLIKVDDAAIKTAYAPSMDFKNYSNAAIEYTYNSNGAMTKDLNKGITRIQYNFLNLPQQIDIKSPVAEARNEYTYSVSGQKLKVVQKWNMDYSTAPVIGSDVNTVALTNTRTTDYIGNKVYENGVLKMILVDGGYIEGNTYHFYLTDHLGNNRIVAKADGTQVQKTHYYPFGSSLGYDTEATVQPYKYNGKELDQMHGLNLYDYSARYYESSIGRFTTVDPLAEKYYSWSPYVYCANNPIRITDPTGMDWEDEKSRRYAEKLSTNMTNRVSSLDKERQTVADNYVKALKSGDSEKAGQLLVQGLELRASIEDLESGITELTAMGSTQDQTFAFKDISGNIGGAERRSDGVIEMQVSGYGSIENGVHESAHGYDLWTGGANTRDNWDTREIKAYGRQYSYNPSSIPSSYWGGVKSRSDITPGWVRGAYSMDGATRNYLYARYILQGVQASPTQIERMLDLRRQNGLP